MKWVNGNIYNYSIELDEHPQQPSGSRSARFYVKGRNVYNYSSINAYFLLLDVDDVEEINGSFIFEQIKIFILSATGTGRLFEKWQENKFDVMSCDISNYIGFTDMTDKYNKEDLYIFKKMRKVLNG